MAADGGAFFDKVGLVTGGADIQGGLHAGNTAAHYHDIGMHRHFPAFQLVMIAHPVDGPGSQGFGLEGGFVFVQRHPGNLLANRGHLEHIGVDARPFACALKGLLMHAGGAGCHHHPIELIGDDVPLDHFLARVRAHELVILGNCHIWQLADKSRYFFHAHLVGDVDTAVADVETDSGCHRCFSCLRSANA